MLAFARSGMNRSALRHAARNPSCTASSASFSSRSDAQREPVGDAAEAVVQLGERRLVRARDEGDDRLVRQVREGPRHRRWSLAHPGAFAAAADFGSPRGCKMYAMPMPHRTQMQVIKRRLVGKDGAERVNASCARSSPDLPGLPQRAVRRHPQVGRRRDRAHADAQARRPSRVHRRCAVKALRRSRSSARRTPASRPCFRRCPRSRSRPGDYAFTTTRPVPAVTPIERRPRPARRDSRADRGRSRGPRRWAARCSASCAEPTRSSSVTTPSARVARAARSFAEELESAGISRSLRCSSRRRRTRRSLTRSSG